MKQVYTNIRTLSQIKRLLNEIGLKELIDDPSKIEINLFELLGQLLDGGKLKEFMQIITKDTQTDWEDVELSEIKEYITFFFIGIIALLPKSIKNLIKATIEGQL